MNIKVLLSGSLYLFTGQSLLLQYGRVLNIKSKGQCSVHEHVFYEYGPYTPSWCAGPRWPLGEHIHQGKVWGNAKGSPSNDKCSVWLRGGGGCPNPPTHLPLALPLLWLLSSFNDTIRLLSSPLYGQTESLTMELRLNLSGMAAAEST